MRLAQQDDSGIGQPLENLPIVEDLSARRVQPLRYVVIAAAARGVTLGQAEAR
jgi:hypothetical protein